MIWLAVLGCKGPEDTDAASTFPAGFGFGTATAGFQVEAGCPTIPAEECEDRASDWYQWVTDPDLIAEGGLFIQGEPLANAPGMWETWEEDVSRMRADGLTTLRLGVEWSRVFPDGAAESATTVEELAAHADLAAVQRYHEMFDALAAAGIEPLVTVNHYTLPLWVHDGKACHFEPDTCAPRDGWVTGDRIVPLITLWTAWLAREYADDVRLWATLNEPLAVPLSGYLLPGESRSNPPGLSFDTERGIASTHNQILASAAMYDAIHAEDPDASVGLVMNVVAIEASADALPADAERAVAHMDHLYHALFFDGLVSGSWDADVDGEFDSTRPELAGRLDWVGVNYYATVTVTPLTGPVLSGLPVFDFFPEIHWYPDPARFDDVLARAAEPGLPLYVTENGQADPDEQVRVDLLDGTLRELQASIAARRDVRGYYYWSYVDNYEWNHGMAMKFGLYGFDPVTKAREERPVMARYREIIGDNGFPE